MYVICLDYKNHVCPNQKLPNFTKKMFLIIRLTVSSLGGGNS